MKRTSMTKQLAVLAALGAIAAGCSGSNDDSQGTRPGTVDGSDNGLFEGDEQGRTDDTANGTTDNSDAEGRLVETSETVAPAEQISDKTDSPRALDMEGEMAAEEPIGESDGGLFETPPPDPDDANARDENNTFEDYGYRDFVETSPRSALDVRTRRRHRFVLGRPPLDRRRFAPTDRVGAPRGVDQRLRLRLRRRPKRPRDLG